jgi:O-antigen/teichoic acid export membrane protein
MAIYNRSSARRSVFDTVIYRAASQVATVLSYILLVRAMPKEDFGVFNLLYAFIPVISTVASLGLEQTLRRYQPEYLAAGNKIAAAWLVRLVSGVRFGTSLLVIGGTLLAWNLVAPLVNLQPYRHEFALFSVLILIHFQVGILQLSLASRMLHRLSVGSMALLAYGKLIAYCLFYWFDYLDLVNAILADTAAYGLAYLSMRIFYNKNVPSIERLEGQLPTAEEKRRMLRYGFYNNFNDAGTLILSSKSDNFFIAAFIDPISVGIYSFYNRLVEMAAQMLPGRLFQNVIQPMFFAVERKYAKEKIPRYFSLLVNINFMIQWPLLAFSIIYHAELVTLVFGTKYVEYSSLLPLILVFSTLNLMATPVTLVAQYEEKSSAILTSKVFAIYNVVALLVLLPISGVYGATIASGSAQFFKTLFIWWFVRDQARWLNFRALATSSVVVWAGAIALGYGLKQYLHVPSIVHLILGGVICGLAELIYLRSPALSSSDRELLGNLMHGKEVGILRWLGIVRPSTADRSAPI